jgi:riboflavin kinase / FMN adenylyltransferase
VKIYNENNIPSNLNNVVLTTGTFDGVHIGHLKIINRLKEISNKINGESTLLTFYPHPRMVLSNDFKDLKLLTTQKEKKHLLEKAGIENLIIHTFTKEFSNLSSLEFIQNILVRKINTKKLVIGYDHHFGKNREGSFENLKISGPVYGFEVEEIPALEINDVNVSSTKIRKALLEGDIENANKYLGYNYLITGKIVKGNQKGRTINFPTANIEIEEVEKLIPKDGVYAVDVEIKGNFYKGMMNIGLNPTTGNNKQSIEVNIFNFEEDIYGQEILVSLKKRLRDEIKFENIEALRMQLEKDKLIALNV